MGLLAKRSDNDEIFQHERPFPHCDRLSGNRTGLSDEGGLFVPESFPQVDLEALCQLDYPELALPSSANI